MRTLSSSMLVGMALIVAGASPAWSQADSYPERPITMIVAHAAGGGTDVAARALSGYITKHLGGNASITVINQPGAGGEIGFTALANAAPDGYTIGFINAPNVLTIPIEREARFSIDDFTPIGNVVDDPGTFAVTVDSPFADLDDLVSYAKENPGAVTYATTGIGSDDHLAGLAFEREAGVKLQMVPMSGGAATRQSLLGGHVDMAAINFMVGGTDSLSAWTSACRASTAALADKPDSGQVRVTMVPGSARSKTDPAANSLEPPNAGTAPP